MADLAPLLADVTQTRVAGLLQRRRPDILNTEDADQVAKFEDRVRGAAVAVVLLTGPDPTAGPIRDLAVECIAAQAASGIEYAEYPEQQGPEQEGRGYYLHQRHLELLALLGRIIAGVGGQIPDDGGANGVRAGGPLGSFPEPLREIDPEPSYDSVPRWYFT